KMARLTQSTIEVMGKSSCDKLDVIAMAIQLAFQDMTEIEFFEMLYQYMQLRVINQDDVIKHRNICIVIASRIIAGSGFINNFQIHPELFNYLLNAISSSKDKWTQLFALIALKEIRLKENELSEMKGKLLEIIN